MNLWRSSELYIVIILFIMIAYGAFVLRGNGTICAFQVRYALSYSAQHAALDRPRITREEAESDLRARFAPNTCSEWQFQEIFEKEAKRWGY